MTACLPQGSPLLSEDEARRGLLERVPVVGQAYSPLATDQQDSRALLVERRFHSTTTGLVGPFGNGAAVVGEALAEQDVGTA